MLWGGTSWRDLGTLMELYRKECRKGDYVDFDGLLSLLVALMQHVPSVLDKYCGMFQYVCFCCFLLVVLVVLMVCDFLSAQKSAHSFVQVCVPMICVALQQACAGG